MPVSALSARLLMTVPMLVAGAALTACGSDSGSGSGTDVAVRAKDDACEVSDTSLDAGTHTFAITNDGSKVTEVYVYGESGSGEFSKVVSEVENIGPGTSRDMAVSLAAGTYEVACKPGQQGDGIRAKVTVSGDGGSGASSSAASGGASSSAAYDREIELTVDDSGLHGLEPATATKGERVEVKLENETAATRTLEVVGPAGNVAVEVEVPAGTSGEAVVELSETGAWTVKVEGGPKDVEATLTVA